MCRADTNPLTCSNCGGTDTAAYRSFDLDLPVVVLCDMCSLAIWSDMEMFEERGKRAKRKPKRRGRPDVQG